MLTSRDIAKMLDHSTLQPFLTEKDIRHGCEVAIKYGTATVCARPQDMEIVVPMLNGTGVLPCTVIGFPHGAHTMEIKAMEAARALEDGCRELDMVINIGRMLGGDYDYVEREIKALAELCHRSGSHPESHHRNLLPQRRAEGEGLPAERKRGRGLCKDQHGLWHRGREDCRRGADAPHGIRPRAGQGQRRHP